MTLRRLFTTPVDELIPKKLYLCLLWVFGILCIPFYIFMGMIVALGIRDFVRSPVSGYAFAAAFVLLVLAAVFSFFRDRMSKHLEEDGDDFVSCGAKLTPRTPTRSASQANQFPNSKQNGA